MAASPARTELSRRRHSCKDEREYHVGGSESYDGETCETQIDCRTGGNGAEFCAACCVRCRSELSPASSCNAGSVRQRRKHSGERYRTRAGFLESVSRSDAG